MLLIAVDMSIDLPKSVDQLDFITCIEHHKIIANIVRLISNVLFIHVQYSFVLYTAFHPVAVVLAG